MNFGLKDETVERICEVFSRHPQVEKAILYGSRAKGNYRNGSDIDLTLIGGEDLDLPMLFKLMDELDDLLLPYTIDLSLFHLIGDPDVVAHVERMGVVFYEKAVEVVLPYQSH
jgi:predicted nucleotidyltransferase